MSSNSHRSPVLAAMALLLVACPPPPSRVPDNPAQNPKAGVQAPPAATHDEPPRAAKRPVKNRYHGVTVTDPYLWLEDGDDPAVKTWSAAQNRYARRVLHALPGRDAIRERVAAAYAKMGSRYLAVGHAGRRYFVLEHRPPKQQPLLLTLPSLETLEGARTVVDPNAIDPSGKTHIDWFRPSPNGALVAVSLSRSGTEVGDVHVFDVATGQQVHEAVPRVNGGTAGGDLVWSRDGKGFFYTRYPRGDERPAKDMSFYVQVYYHRLGTPGDKDRYEIGKSFVRIAEIDLKSDPRSDRVLATVQNGDGGEFEHHVRYEDGRWKKISGFKDQILEATFGPSNDLYVVSTKDAPRGKILRLRLRRPVLRRAKLIVPEGEQPIVAGFWDSGLVVSRTRIYAIYQLGGPSEVRVFDRRGRSLKSPGARGVSSVSELQLLDRGKLLYFSSSYVDPGAWTIFDPNSREAHRTALRHQQLAALESVRVVREMATSQDGTKVPVNIMIPAGFKRDGSGAAVASGYGGYGLSLPPRYRPWMVLLLEQGVLVAEANLRGGGEFGEKWHRQGNLTNKQNVFDDFAAVCRHLIARKYTTSARLAIEGGSNGGLLMGATLVQQPKLAKAVVSFVGIYDMLRVELSPNGAFNTTEFGTVKDAEQFVALHAYSPYHNVVDGTAYPAVLMLTGANDPRVEPWHSRKMVARLQEATSSDAPILLRTSDTGHGSGTALSERIEQLASVHAFIFDQLGVRFTPPGGGE